MKNEIYICIRNYDELLKYKDEWNRLWVESNCSIFSSFLWYSSLLIAKSLSNIKISVNIWILLESGVVTCIAPLKVEGNNVMFLSNYEADYQDFIYEDLTSCEKMLAFIKSQYSPLFKIKLSDIPEDSKTIDLIKSVFNEAEQSVSEICPFVCIDKNEKIYFSRKDYKRKKNKLLNIGKLHSEFYYDLKSILYHLPIMKLYFYQRWKDNKESNFFFEKFDDVFMEEITKSLSQKKYVLLSVLFSNNTPICYYFGFVEHQKYLFYRSSFNGYYKDYSPGVIALNDLLSYCSQNDIKEFDFLRGNYSYKKKYATNARKNIKLEE